MEIESIEQPRQRGASQQLLPVARSEGAGELKNTRRDDVRSGGMEEASKQRALNCALIFYQTEKTRQSTGVKVQFFNRDEGTSLPAGEGRTALLVIHHQLITT